MSVDHYCYHHNDCSLFSVGLVIAVGTRSKRRTNLNSHFFNKKKPNGSLLLSSLSYPYSYSYYSYY